MGTDHQIVSARFGGASILETCVKKADDRKQRFIHQMDQINQTWFEMYEIGKTPLFSWVCRMNMIQTQRFVKYHFELLISLQMRFFRNRAFSDLGIIWVFIMRPFLIHPRVSGVHNFWKIIENCFTVLSFIITLLDAIKLRSLLHVYELVEKDISARVRKFARATRSAHTWMYVNQFGAT